MNVLRLHRIGRWCHRHRVPLLPGLIRRLMFLLYNSFVPLSVEIGEGTVFAYGGMGLLIHHEVRIGRNVTISPQVTIGGRFPRVGIPIIEDGVYIAPGARILGPVRIGEASIIGANAVVIHDVPARSVVAGVPARVIRTLLEHEVRPPRAAGKGGRR